MNLRRIRGALGMGALWSVPWGVGTTIATGMMTYAFVSRIAVALKVGVWMGFSGALLGFAMGTLFSLILMTAEGEKGLAKLSASRFAAWGALAGAGLSSAFVALAFGEAGILPFGVFVGAFAALGATCSTASLVLARRGGDAETPRELPAGARR